ncbi:hypothetical protein [Algoriphagus hitonicola]|uniref:hypothetical protein n=1 Tax=Algoriphagus hitonicola TaxID=435880 RepID=UPI0015A7064C|nr:hypothetical protein [Algoriphagus hitonicola]
MKKTKWIIGTLLMFSTVLIGYSDCQTTHTNGYCDQQEKAGGGVKKTCVEKPTENSEGRCLFKKDGEIAPEIG